MSDTSLFSNSVELNAYRYWMTCKALDSWTDTATLVVCHLLQSRHPAIKARAEDLARRVQAAKNDGWEIYEDAPEPA